MKIAVTYENGQIFQHFGHTENMKFYEVKDGKIIASNVLSTNGSGHGALATFLKSNNADMLICGGIGGGAQTALANADIKLFAGVSGSADEAVDRFLAGNLEFSDKANCDHHSNEGHECGNDGCGKSSCSSH